MIQKWNSYRAFVILLRSGATDICSLCLPTTCSRDLLFYLKFINDSFAIFIPRFKLSIYSFSHLFHPLNTIGYQCTGFINVQIMFLQFWWKGLHCLQNSPDTDERHQIVVRHHSGQQSLCCYFSLGVPRPLILGIFVNPRVYDGLETFNDGSIHAIEYIIAGMTFYRSCFTQPQQLFTLWF